MTTYLGDKAVGIGTIKATKAVAGDVLHDNTLKGNGNAEPLGVDTQVIATNVQVGNLSTVLHAGIEAQAEAIAKTRNDFEVADQEIREDLNETSSELQTQITAQATEVNKLKESIAGLGSLSYSVVDVLPEVGEKGVVYLVPKDGEQPDVHDEYLWIDGQFELIGTTQVDLSNYVQKTDIATHSKAGLLLGVGSGFRANIYGMPQCDSLTTTSYNSVASSYFISKGSIENLKDDIVKRAITANSITLTEEEQTAAKNWLGVAEGGGDLSNYVQKTDYASSKAAGLIRGYNANGFGFVPDTGYPYCENKSLASYNSAGGNLFIGKGTLEAIKYSYVRDGIAKNTYSLSDSEKEKVRNWIGAGEPTVFETMPDIYASAGKIYQYAGETTEELTKGYFYTAVSQGLSYMPSDSNITFDFDLFWSELESAGITLETLQMAEIDKERGGFSIIGTVESVTNYRVQNINGIPLDVLLTQSIRSTSEYVGANNRWYYKPSETFAWERVDVQPVPEVNGDFLPLSGGTLTGALVFDGGSYSYKFEPKSYSQLDLGFYSPSNIGTWTFSPLSFQHNKNKQATLGSSVYRWKNVYTTTINNGADIAVPTTGGTMALKEDIDAAVGNISTALTAILGE
jgi:hypothetical protein